MITYLLNQYLNSDSDSVSSESSEMSRDKREKNKELTAAERKIKINTIKTVTIRAERESKLLISKSLLTVREREMNRIYN